MIKDSRHLRRKLGVPGLGAIGRNTRHNYPESCRDPFVPNWNWVWASCIRKLTP